jgi:hypothetical protein
VNLCARGLAAISWLAVAGCGTDAPPATPTLQLPFTSSSASPVLFNNVEGVPVGTTGSFGFGALNGGTQSLILQEVSYDGDPEMALQPFASPLPATLAFDDEFIIGLTCTPLALQGYTGVVSLASNASNNPNAVVYLICTGVPP